MSDCPLVDATGEDVDELTAVPRDDEVLQLAKPKHASTSIVLIIAGLLLIMPEIPFSTIRHQPATESTN